MKDLCYPSPGGGGYSICSLWCQPHEFVPRGTAPDCERCLKILHDIKFEHRGRYYPYVEVAAVAEEIFRGSEL